jgi:hypothetical protein
MTFIRTLPLYKTVWNNKSFTHTNKHTYFEVMLHQHSKGHMATVQLYWWRKTFGTLFHPQTSIWEESPKLAGYISHLKKLKLSSGIQTNSSEGQVVWNQGPQPLSYKCSINIHTLASYFIAAAYNMATLLTDIPCLIICSQCLFNIGSQ